MLTDLLKTEATEVTTSIVGRNVKSGDRIVLPASEYENRRSLRIVVLHIEERYANGDLCAEYVIHAGDYHPSERSDGYALIWANQEYDKW